MTYLLLTVHFLDDRYHGLLNRYGPPEWPPSPFRLFCALVAGVARRGELETDVGKALAWLQTLDPPIIIAPKSITGQTFTRFVPNNDGDKKPDRQERLTAKLTIPTLMLLNGDEKPKVHYLWKFEDNTDIPFDRVRDATRSLTTFGWGIDMAFADAKTLTDSEVELLQGVRWFPKKGVWRDTGMLRIPIYDKETDQNTLSDLKHCHKSMINRIEHGKPLHTVDKPRVFERVFYTSVERPIGRHSITFKLINPDASLFHYPQSQLIHISGMVRHLAIQKMKESPPVKIEEKDVDNWVDTYVAGHNRSGDSNHKQFSYIPLSSIGHRHTNPSIRRVMIVAPLGDDHLLEHLARRLGGEPLKPTQKSKIKVPPTLVRVKYDKVSDCYTKPANIWTSVTPVILPGHDDHKPEKTIKLIEKALAQSGIEQPCEFEWSAISRFSKSMTAHKYERDQNDPDKKITKIWLPKYLQKMTALHLTLRFKDGVKVPGPLAIGAGRHCGFGILAACPNYVMKE